MIVFVVVVVHIVRYSFTFHQVNRFCAAFVIPIFVFLFMLISAAGILVKRYAIQLHNFRTKIQTDEKEKIRRDQPLENRATRVPCIHGPLRTRVIAILASSLVPVLFCFIF